MVIKSPLILRLLQILSHLFALMLHLSGVMLQLGIIRTGSTLFGVDYSKIFPVANQEAQTGYIYRLVA